MKRIILLIMFYATIQQLGNGSTNSGSVRKIMDSQQSTAIGAGTVSQNVQRINRDGREGYRGADTKRIAYDIGSVEGFVLSYRGSKMDRNYVKTLTKYCTLKELKSVVAVGLAETGLGRDTKNGSNFYGYFKGGNRKYDPGVEVIAKEMCDAVRGRYKNLPSRDTVAMYIYGRGNYSQLNSKQQSGVDNWIRRYNWALNKMK